jgi:hypothetical protein
MGARMHVGEAIPVNIKKERSYVFLLTSRLCPILPLNVHQVHHVHRRPFAIGAQGTAEKGATWNEQLDLKRI